MVVEMAVRMVGEMGEQLADSMVAYWVGWLADK
jgi:hypothetical protein